MKKFKDLYKNLEEAAEGIEGYPPGFSTGAGEKRRVDGDSFGGFRVGEGNTISRINAFLNKFLAGSYMAGDYKFVLRELRVRLNHIGLDFDSEKQLVEGENRIKVKLHGDTFGTTPTTDLMKGFDHGEDLPSMTMVINYTHDKNTEMCYMSGKLVLDSMNEGAIGAWVGRAAGSAIGSVVPGIGTAIGGAVGGMIGSAAGDAMSKPKQPQESEVGEDGKLSPKQKRIAHIKKLRAKKMGEGTTVYEEKKN
jgi:hypothetical protein